MTRSAFIAGVVVVMTALPLPADEKKTEGKEVKPLLVMHGRKSKIDEASCQRITTEKDWRRLWTTHKTGSPDQKNLPRDFEYADPDFEQVEVIAVFAGVSEDIAFFGLRSHSVHDVGDEIVVRVVEVWGQVVLGSNDDESLEEKQARQNTDWVFIVLPRSTKKIVVATDQYRRNEADHKWQELKRFKSESK